jgi:DNA-binding protein HU-beta
MAEPSCFCWNARLSISINSRFEKSSSQNFSSMNKAQLVEAVQKTLGKETSKAEAERAVGAVIEALKTGLKKEKVVQLIGFGTFKVAERKARTGINPKTREKIRIKKSKTVKFSPGKELKSRI